MSDYDETKPPDLSQADDVSDERNAPTVIGLSWQEQDPTLRDLWLQNRSPQDISAVLGRSVAAIMTRAARLGLPRRSAPGRKPGTQRPLQDGEVRKTMPRPAFNRTEENNLSTQVSTRICLMCLRPFQSQGRHNRICQSCKHSSEYESAVSLADISIPI